MESGLPARTSTAAGAVFLVAAQVCVGAFGYVMQASVARILGPADYGTFGVTFSALYIAVLFVSTGVPAAVSRQIAAEPTAALALRSLGLRLQGLGCLVVAGAYFSTAGFWAQLLADPGLEPYLRLSALAIPAYAFVNSQLGYFNGLHLFSRQAVGILVYGLSRMVFITGLAYLFGLLGSVGAAALGPLLALLVALWLSPAVPRTMGVPSASTRDLLAFAVPVMVLAVTMQLLLTLDLFYAKAFIADDLTVGYYAAASTLGRLPYFVFPALGSVLLPAVSRSVAGASDKTPTYFARQATRAILICGVIMVALSAAKAEPLIAMLFSPKYTAAAAALPILMMGVSLISYFYVLTSLQAGAGQVRRPAAAGLTALAFGAIAGQYLVPSQGMVGAALTCLAMGTFACAISLVAVSRAFGGFWPFHTTWRCLVAAVPAAALAALLPAGTVGTLASLMMGGLVYLLLLWLLREFGAEDWELLNRYGLVLRIRGRLGARSSAP